VVSDETPPVPAADDETPAGPSGPDHQTSDASPDQTTDEGTSQVPLTPESAKALADRVIEETFIPKKVPAVDDIEAQTKAVGGAMASALLTATDVPIGTLQPVVANLAAQMVALGIRQTEHVDPAALHAPAWITDGVRQQSVKLPDPPKHTEAEPVVARTATAPEPPEHITDWAVRR
jgi:hypothetical protein